MSSSADTAKLTDLCALTFVSFMVCTPSLNKSVSYKKQYAVASGLAFAGDRCYFYILWGRELQDTISFRIP